jgi:hypothetical protein
MAAFDKKQMDVAVNRFLGWKLPQTFGPDCYVSFDREKAQANHSWPVGTNLLTADEARAMLEYVLEAVKTPPDPRQIADHLFIDRREDGVWLVCVDKVHDTEESARASCQEWMARYYALTGAQPAPAAPSKEDYRDTLQAVFNAVGYTEEYARQWPKEKASVTFKRWFDEKLAAAQPAHSAMTDEQIDAIFHANHNPEESPWVNWRRFARALIAASKEKHE